MSCPRCGKALPPGAGFCMHCGQMLAQPSASAGGAAITARPAAAPRSGSKLWVAVLLTALGAAALFSMLFATGVLRFGGSQKPGYALAVGGSQANANLPATGNQGSDNLAVTGAQPPPNLPAQAEKVVMPDNVRRWLEHLERIEKRKIRLVNDQISKALVQLQYLLGAGATADMLKGLIEEANTGEEVQGTPAQSTEKSISELNVDWDRLVADFNSYPPPPPCVPLRNEYDQHIREVRASIGDILRAFQTASESPEAAIQILRNIQGAHKKDLDAAGEKSEKLLEEICARYNTRQWFHIDPDPGKGKGLLGARGF
jgi:hypothetical protein